MPYYYTEADITAMEVDAIVNAISTPVIGSGFILNGTDTELPVIENLQAGQAAITKTGVLPRCIIHTVLPNLDSAYDTGAVPAPLEYANSDIQLLVMCYYNAIRVAYESGCRSLAIPDIYRESWGISRGFAQEIARISIDRATQEYDIDVSIVFRHACDVIVDKSISDRLEEYCKSRLSVSGLLKLDRFPGIATSSAAVALGGILSSKLFNDIKDYIDQHKQKSFSETLMDEIQKAENCAKNKDAKKDSYYYSKAGINKATFSKIRSNKDYHPEKGTVLAFAIVLEMTTDKAVRLLDTAGYSLSMSNDTDMIVACCLENKIYDVGRVNSILFSKDLPQLCGKRRNASADDGGWCDDQEKYGLKGR